MALSDLENLPHYVYVIHSEINDIVYYGFTCDPVGRWKGHLSSANCGYGDPLYEAMRVHGAHRFTLTVLCKCETRSEARKVETGYIDRGRKAGNVYNKPVGDTITLTLDPLAARVVKHHQKDPSRDVYDTLRKLVFDGHSINTNPPTRCECGGYRPGD